MEINKKGEISYETELNRTNESDSASEWMEMFTIRKATKMNDYKGRILSFVRRIKHTL